VLNPIERLYRMSGEFRDKAEATKTGAQWVASVLRDVPENNWALDAPWDVVHREARFVVLRISQTAMIEVTVSYDPSDTVWCWGYDDCDPAMETDRVSPEALRAFYKEHFT